MPPGVTSTRCMEKYEASAEQMWSTDLSSDMHPVSKQGYGKSKNKGTKLDKFAKQAAARARGARKKKKGTAKGAAKGSERQESLSS